MTEEVTVEVEAPASESENSPEEIAEAIVDAQEEAQEEAEQEAAVDNAVEASQSALEAVATHEHMEYAHVEHEHGVSLLHERMDTFEARLSAVEVAMESPAEEEPVEEIEPVHEPSPEPERRRPGFRRGRR